MNDASTPDTEIPEDSKTQEPRLWRDDGWTAQVIKNEDDDGWAVAMTKDGEAEPSLIGPWTIGRGRFPETGLKANKRLYTQALHGTSTSPLFPGDL